MTDGELPQISVIIPVHNEETILRSAVLELRAAMQALGRDYEIILAENGSVDRTVEIAHELVGELAGGAFSFDADSQLRSSAQGRTLGRARADPDLRRDRPLRCTLSRGCRQTARAGASRRRDRLQTPSRKSGPKAALPASRESRVFGHLAAGCSVSGAPTPTGRRHSSARAPGLSSRPAWWTRTCSRASSCSARIAQGFEFEKCRSTSERSARHPSICGSVCRP